MSKNGKILITAITVASLLIVLLLSRANVMRALAPNRAAAGAPGMIAYQGYLTDDSGQPFTGMVDLRFGLYRETTGDSALWTELHSDVPVSNGYFTLHLGSINPLNAANFNESQRFLEIEVDKGNGFVTLQRQQFMAVPYALQAQQAASVAWDGITDVPANVGVEPTPVPYPTAAPPGWYLDGNSGTNSAILGTTDETSLTLVINDTAVLRFDPANDPQSNFSPNITANPFSNEIQTGAYSSVIGGGRDNVITDGVWSTISGGWNNRAGRGATVSGGWNNNADGIYSTVSGGYSNRADGDFSYAAGSNAQAIHDGAFVWSDSGDSPFASTGNDQFLVQANGGMGVGTDAPATQLHVVAARNGAANMTEHVVAIENNSTSFGNGPDVLALKVTNQSNPGGSTNYITFTDKDGGVGSVEGNGSGGVTYKTSGADFAEYLPLENLSETIGPGSIVGLSQGRVSQRTAGAEQLFVVSSAAGFVGNATGDEQPEGTVLVALIGQVLAQVRGAVQAGDMIVASGLNDGLGVAVPLTALSAEQVGQVIGLALKSNDGNGPVLVLVGLPNDVIWQALLQTRDDQLADIETRLTQLEQRASGATETETCTPPDTSDCSTGGANR